MNTVKNIISYYFDKPDRTYNLRLCSVEREICILQLVDKNVFVKYSAKEILQTPELFSELSPENIIFIARIEYGKNHKKYCTVIERDRNRTILVKLPNGKLKRYAEAGITNNFAKIKLFNSIDAHRIGYNAGFNDGYLLMKKITSKKTAKIFSLVEKKFPSDQE